MVVNVGKVNEVKEKYQLKHKDLAEFLAISEKQLWRMATGEQDIAEKHLESLKIIEQFYEDEEPLQLLFDYVRIRFETTNVDYIIKNILLINLDIIEAEEGGWYGYKKHYAFGDIVIMYDTLDIKKGVLIELKGKGCRQFEQMLEAQGRSWYDFFYCAAKHEGIMRRIDLAVDDTVGILDIPYFIKKNEADECYTVFKKYDVYSASEIKQGEDKEKLMGKTLYIGSKRSDIYFCLYEKDYERYLQTGVLPTFHQVKNRFEIRLKNDRAINMIKAYMRTNALENVAFDIINRYVSYKVAEIGVELKDCKMDVRWQMFLGIGRKKLKLTTKPEPVTLERTWKWINKQVAPTLKMLVSLDAIEGTNKLSEAIEDAILQPQHEKQIATQIYKAKDVIV